MTNEIRLQGIGMVEGTCAGLIQVGDVLRWNYGSLERVTAIEFTKTAKTIICQTEYFTSNGELVQSERKMRVTRLVNIFGSGKTILTGQYYFEYVKEVEEIKAVDMELTFDDVEEEAAAVEEVAAEHIIKAEIIHASYGEIKPLNIIIKESKKKVNEALFRAIYSQNNNSVTIAYGSKKVMKIGNVSKNYNIEGKNGMQIAEIVFKANKEGSISVVQDFIL
jgi:hypothetical protein